MEETVLPLIPFFKPQMFRDAKLVFSTVFRWLLTSNYLNILALQHQ
jgi:hypothetical protein